MAMIVSNEGDPRADRDWKNGSILRCAGDLSTKPLRLRFTSLSRRLVFKGWDDARQIVQSADFMVLSADMRALRRAG